jgi:hypothetical protein
LVLAVGLVIAGVLGRAASGTMHLSSLEDPRDSTPTWAMAVEDAMSGVRVEESAKKGAVAFGIVPDAAFAQTHPGYVGIIDYLAMEALADVGVAEALRSPIKPALASRDLAAVCGYLRAFPNSLRVTGPELEAGPGMLVESGCSRDVVKPDQWVSLNFDPPWLVGTPWARG